jgi:hypothetical protein
MKDILYIRATIINLIKRHEGIIAFSAKFAVGLTAYVMIFSLGMYNETLSPLFTAPLAFPFAALLAVSFAFLPSTANYALMSLTVAAQLSSSLETAAFTLLFLICVIIFYTRLSPQKSYLILALLLGFAFKVPYAVVIFAGLYMGVSSVIPVAIGTSLYYFIPTVTQAARALPSPAEIDVIELPVRLIDAYTILFEGITADFNWVIVTFIFIMVILGIHAVSALSIDYAKEISIAFGGIVSLLCFAISSAVISGFNLSVIAVLLGTAASVCIVFIIRFFDGLPEYQRTENVRFEDDENYYYVKIVPKLAFPKTKEPRLARRIDPAKREASAKPAARRPSPSPSPSPSPERTVERPPERTSARPAPRPASAARPAGRPASRPSMRTIVPPTGSGTTKEIPKSD